MKVWEAIYDVFAEMGLLNQVGEATGGSTTTVADSTLSMDTDVKKGGSIILFSTTDAGAPQGEIKRVASNTSTTYTTSAFSASVGAGDLYAYVSKDFNVYELLPLVNMALKSKCPAIPQTDTSITTALSQREYTLPTAVKAGKIYNVQIQTNTGDSDDNRWAPIYNWKITYTAGGSTALLVLHDQPTKSRTIKIEYMAPHTTVTAFSDEINEALHPALVRSALKYQLNQSRNEEAIASQDGFRDLYNASRDEYQEALRMWPVPKPRQIAPARTFGRA